MRWRQADLNRRQAIGLIAAAAVAWPVRAHAADQWPARTVRLVVPALGSPTDTLDWPKIFPAAKRLGGITNYFVEQNWDLFVQSIAYLKTLNV